MVIAVESIKTYTDLVDFWHWGELSALTNLVESARHFCLELIISGKSRLECNKQLQSKFNINKRWSSSIYTEVQAIVDNINENRKNHIKVIEGQIKSIKFDINQRIKQIKKYQKELLGKKGFAKIKAACNINASARQSTELQDAKFALHQKKRRLYLLSQQLEHIKSNQPNYVLPDSNGFMLVGSKDESSGNESAQFDYIESTDKFILSIRTPYALEEKLGGKYIRIDGLNFKHG